MAATIEKKTRKEQMQERMRVIEKKIVKVKGIGPAFGLAKGLSITLRTMMKRSVTQQYPHVKPDLPARSRGVIALKEENCTVCMLCSRECPDWCIYIDSHKEVMPPKTPGARARTRNVLDRFAIDFALCMYCGICIEVCPFDALFWTPKFEYSTFHIAELIHEMPTLAEHMSTVKPPDALEAGAEDPKEVAAEAKIIGEPVGAAVSAPPAAATTAAPAAASAPEAAAPAPAAAAAAAEDHEPPQIDEEVFQRELAAGKSEREARAMAKRAWVIKRRKGQG